MSESAGSSHASESSELSESSDRPTREVDPLRDVDITSYGDNLPLPEPDDEEVRSRILTADPNRVRKTLLELAGLSPAISRAMMRILAPPTDETPSAASAVESALEGGAFSIRPSFAVAEALAPSTSSASRDPLSISSLVTRSDEPPAAASSSRKRQRSLDLEVCMYCREIFAEKSGGTCRTHPGSLEVDWDDEYWADADPEIHDTSPDSDNRHAQRWSCCDGDGWSKGCRTGPHEAKFNPKKYRKHLSGQKEAGA